MLSYQSLSLWSNYYLPGSNQVAVFIGKDLSHLTGTLALPNLHTGYFTGTGYIPVKFRISLVYISLHVYHYRYTTKFYLLCLSVGMVMLLICDGGLAKTCWS